MFSLVYQGWWGGIYIRKKCVYLHIYAVVHIIKVTLPLY